MGRDQKLGHFQWVAESLVKKISPPSISRSLTSCLLLLVCLSHKLTDHGIMWVLSIDPPRTAALCHTMFVAMLITKELVICHYIQAVEYPHI